MGCNADPYQRKVYPPLFVEYRFLSLKTRPMAKSFDRLKDVMNFYFNPAGRGMALSL
jgi:hypothetical protein